MNSLIRHVCESCKGSGKVVSQRTREFRGVKRTDEFLVDCPGKLMEALLRGSPGIEGNVTPGSRRR